MNLRCITKAFRRLGQVCLYRTLEEADMNNFVVYIHNNHLFVYMLHVPHSAAMATAKFPRNLGVDCLFNDRFIEVNRFHFEKCTLRNRLILTDII